MDDTHHFPLTIKKILWFFLAKLIPWLSYPYLRGQRKPCAQEIAPVLLLALSSVNLVSCDQLYTGDRNQVVCHMFICTSAIPATQVLFVSNSISPVAYWTVIMLDWPSGWPWVRKKMTNGCGHVNCVVLWHYFIIIKLILLSTTQALGSCSIIWNWHCFYSVC